MSLEGEGLSKTSSTAPLRSLPTRTKREERAGAAYLDRAVAGPKKTLPLAKLSVNVAHDVARRLRRLAFEQRLSESSIVEIALRLMFAQRDDAALGRLLRQRRASLRRKVGP